MSKDSRDRLKELLAWRATHDLNAAEELELEGLLAEHPDWEDEGFELAAAALELAWADEAEPLPEHLRRKLLRDARAYFSESRPPAQKMRLVQTSGRQKPAQAEAARRPAFWAGWAAAAALLIVSLMAWLPRLQSPPSPSQARLELLARDPRALLLEWQATEDPLAQDASGDVLWSPERQAGFMRIRGLQSNDPQNLQYQLWIFDAERDERYPVDGGVFDIPAAADEVVVPIRAKLPVGDAHLFAVTVERPGGVVVSSRQRIVLLANTG